MKKLISLIASLSLVATMFTTAYAAELANNRPVVNSVIEELSAEDYKVIAEEDLPAGCHAYYVTVDVTGLDLEVKSGSGVTGKKQRTGLLLKSASYEIKFEDDKNLVAAYFMDGILDDGCTEEQPVFGAKAWTSVNDGIPTVENGDTTGIQTNSIDMCELLIVTSGELSGTVYSEFSVQIVTNSTLGDALYIDKAHDVQATYTVDGVAGAAIKFGASAPVDPITVGKRHDLAAGKAWDVTINEYDAAKTYTATFTDTDTTETKVNDFDLSIFAESDGAKVAFVTLLKTTRANITLDVE